MIVQIVEFVLTGLVNVIQVSQDLIVHLLNAQEDAQTTDIVQVEFVIVDKDGVVILVKLLFVQTIATIMVNVLMENAIVELGLLEMIVQLEHAQQIVITRENALTILANVTVDILDSIVHSNHAVQNVQETDIATMVHVSVNQDSQEFLVHFQHAHHHAQEMEDVSQLVPKWHVNVMKDLKDMIVQKKLVHLIVQVMVNALKEFVHVKMVGEEMIVPHVVQDMVKDVVEMENVLKDNVIATLDGLVMDVILELAFMIVHNTVIVVMVLVFAKKVIVEEIVHFRQNHNPVNVLFTVFVVVFKNVQLFMKLKVQQHHMNVIQNAHNNVFLSVLQEKILMF